MFLSFVVIILGAILLIFVIDSHLDLMGAQYKSIKTG